MTRINDGNGFWNPFGPPNLSGVFGLLFIPVVLLLLSGCWKDNLEYKQANVEMITTGPGPEDIVLDDHQGRNRLIISCNQRREGLPEYGALEWFDLEGNELSSRVFTLENFPGDISLKPHGLDLREVNGQLLLYVVNHDNENTNSILIFEVKESSLGYLDRIAHEMILTPNAVTIDSEGGMYITNDGIEMDRILEFLIFQNTGSLVYCTRQGDCRVVTDELTYPNGVLQTGPCLFLATSAQNELIRFDANTGGDIANRKVVLRGTGFDNIRMQGDELIIAKHDDLLAFLQHSVNPAVKSPFKIIAVNHITGESRSLFYDDGSRMSGASTGLIAGDYLYIAQVFEPFLLKVRMQR